MGVQRDRRAWQAEMWDVPIESIHEIEADALRAWDASEEYRNGSVSLKRVGNEYEVTFGDLQRYLGPERTRAISTVLIYVHRRCTSCGARGCPQDISPRKGFIVEPLPEGWK